MMYALYGTHGKYCDLVSQNGVSRSTAAYFLLSEQCSRERLLVTLTCSIFHAIGLQTIGKAIQNHTTLSEELKPEDGICLLLLSPGNAAPEPTLLDTYQYRGITTYPYGKVKQIGPAPAPVIRKLEIPDAVLNRTIHSEHPQRELRFFQKNSGCVRFLDNCSIPDLEAVCASGAEVVAPSLQCFLNNRHTGSMNNDAAN